VAWLKVQALSSNPSTAKKEKNIYIYIRRNSKDPLGESLPVSGVSLPTGHLGEMR
jgi:hypothetical protein